MVESRGEVLNSVNLMTEFCVASTGGTGGRDREKCGIMQNEEQEYRRLPVAVTIEKK